MKILITGGAGYIGSVLTEVLLHYGHQVTVLDNLSYNQSSLFHLCVNKRLKFVCGDARELSLVHALISDCDVVFPLAALVGVPACDKDMDLAVALNVGSIKTLLKARELSAKDITIIYPTTNSGYGLGTGDVHCTEETPLRPISLYGRTKVEAESLILDAGNSITLRLATVFGMSSRMRLDLLVNDFVYRAVTDGYLVLFEEDFKRNYIHVRDVAETMAYCMRGFRNLKNETYNVGLSDANLSKRELANKIKKHVPQLVIMSSEVGKDPDKRNYIVDNSKLENTGWFPRFSLDDGIIELIKGYGILANLGKYDNI